MTHGGQCMGKAYACGTHGIPCVCMALLRAIDMGTQIKFMGAAARRRRRKGKKKERK